MAETAKAKQRRIREGFFDAYCQGRGIDIGCGDDPLDGATTWDWGDGDAVHVNGLTHGVYDFVYSSHCLEHLSDPVLAIQNWWRLLKSNGYLILFVPHRDLFERSRTLRVDPSDYANPVVHRCFILPDRSDPPHTWGLLDLVNQALGNAPRDFIYMKRCDENYEFRPWGEPLPGEFSIELVMRKGVSDADL